MGHTVSLREGQGHILTGRQYLDPGNPRLYPFYLHEEFHIHIHVLYLMVFLQRNQRVEYGVQPVQKSYNLVSIKNGRLNFF